jgi:hypothetical protein
VLFFIIATAFSVLAALGEPTLLVWMAVFHNALLASIYPMRRPEETKRKGRCSCCAYFTKDVNIKDLEGYKIALRPSSGLVLSGGISIIWLHFPCKLKETGERV